MTNFHSAHYLADFSYLLSLIHPEEVDRLVDEIAGVRDRGGRLYILGLGGSAANAAHLAADLQNLCEVDAVAPMTNIAALTASANDHGWENALVKIISPLWDDDALLVFSVGGGTATVSSPITRALETASAFKVPILGIVGRDGGRTATLAKACLIVPTVNADWVTPFAESMQVLIGHAIVFHPKLKRKAPKW